MFGGCAFHSPPRLSIWRDLRCLCFRLRRSRSPFFVQRLVADFGVEPLRETCFLRSHSKFRAGNSLHHIWGEDISGDISNLRKDVCGLAQRAGVVLRRSPWIVLMPADFLQPPLIGGNLLLSRRGETSDSRSLRRR